MTSENGSQTGDTVPREQVEAALQFLEWSHGDALNRPWSAEAHAYYEAIDIIEAALDKNLRPADEVPWRESAQEAIERSRASRDDGYAAATLLHERYGESDTSERGLLSRIVEKFV